MNIFLQKDHKFKGIHRLVEGFTIHPDFSIIEVANIDETNEHECECAIFAGFLPSSLSRNKNASKKYYVYCSPLGQADLSSFEFYSMEFQILMDAEYFLKDNKIDGIITGSESLKFSNDFMCMPHVRLGIEEHISFNKKRSGYGFLGNNSRKHRNVSNQISAISKLTPKESIVVAHSEEYKNYEKLYSCTFTSKNMDTDSAYFKEIATHILGFQCSWSEAFNYIAWEYAFMGVPCVVSPCIDWYPNAELIVLNPDSPKEIYETAQSLLNNNEYYSESSYNLAEWALEYNKEQKAKLMEKLERLIKDDFA